LSRGVVRRGAEGEGADAVGDLDEVGVSLFEDLDLDGGLPLVAGDDLAVAGVEGDAGDGAEADRLAVAGGDGEVGELVEAAELVEGADEVADAAVLQLAAGEVDVLGGEALLDLGRGEGELGEAVLVEIDADDLLLSAAGSGGGDAFGFFKLARELFGQGAQLCVVGVAVEAEAEDGVEVGVVAKEEGSLCVVGEGEEVDALADALCGEVHVSVPVELELDVAAVGAAGGGDGADALDGAEDLFEGSGDVLFDLFGRGALVDGACGDGGPGEGGHEREGELAEGEEAEDGDPGGDHEGGDGALDGEAPEGVAHGVTTWTRAPSLRPACPRTMTRSPSWRPERISILLSAGAEGDADACGGGW
jgi:hypothetical protein